MDYLKSQHLKESPEALLFPKLNEYSEDPDFWWNARLINEDAAKTEEGQCGCGRGGVSVTSGVGAANPASLRGRELIGTLRKQLVLK